MGLLKNYMIEVMPHHEALDYLIEQGYVDGPAAGIARQVIEKGRESLSSKKDSVFRKFVEEPYLNIECSRCHIPVPTCELIGAWEDGGRCSWCNKMISNDD